MSMAGLVAAQDLITAVAGVWNAGYFAGYWWRRSGHRARRIGAAALTLVSAAAVAGALLSQLLLWSGDLPQGLWALLRAPALAATVFVSLIVVRRLLA
jgi:hypothetical protein